jgi:hypothetical protein
MKIEQIIQYLNKNTNMLKIQQFNKIIAKYFF